MKKNYIIFLQSEKSANPEFMWIKKLFPIFIRRRIKEWRLFQFIHGIKLACTTHRLDKLAWFLNKYLKKANIDNLENKKVLELGGGWIPGWSALFFLLGVKEIRVIDEKRYWFPFLLQFSLLLSSRAGLLEYLEEFVPKNILQQRIAKIRRGFFLSLFHLRYINIHYSAPLSIRNLKEFSCQFDFIFSNAVLQYIPVKEIYSYLLLQSALLRPEGKMLHFVHLEDMTFYKKNPFLFLTESSEKQEPGRGNRLRKSSWIKILKNIKDMDIKIIDYIVNNTYPLPVQISKEVEYADEADLRTSHIVIYGKKKLPA